MSGNTEGEPTNNDLDLEQKFSFKVAVFRVRQTSIENGKLFSLVTSQQILSDV